MRRDTKNRHDNLIEWAGWALAVFIFLGFTVLVFLGARLLFHLADEYYLVRAVGVVAFVCLFVAAVSGSRD